MKTIVELTKQYQNMFETFHIPPISICDVANLMEDGGALNLVWNLNLDVITAFKTVLSVAENEHTIAVNLRGNLKDLATSCNARATEYDLLKIVNVAAENRIKVLNNEAILLKSEVGRQIRRVEIEQQTYHNLELDMNGTMMRLHEVEARNKELEALLAKKKRKVSKDSKVKLTVENNTPIFIDGECVGTFYEFADGNHMTDAEGRKMRHILEAGKVYCFDAGTGGKHFISALPRRVKKQVAPKTIKMDKWWVVKIHEMCWNGLDADFTLDQLREGESMEDLYKQVSMWNGYQNRLIERANARSKAQEIRRLHIHWMPWSEHTKFTVSLYRKSHTEE
jgi:hypothetical protein